YGASDISDPLLAPCAPAGSYGATALAGLEHLSLRRFTCHHAVELSAVLQIALWLSLCCKSSPGHTISRMTYTGVRRAYKCALCPFTSVTRRVLYGFCVNCPMTTERDVSSRHSTSPVVQ